MDTNSLKKGDLVTIIDYEGRKLERKTVEISVDTVYVCTEEEFENAENQGLEPICVGFKSEFVIALSR